MSTHANDPKWTRRISTSARAMAVAGLAIAAAGVTLARYDAIPKLAGFGGLAFGGLLALLAFVLGLIGLVLNLRHPTPTRGRAVLALVLSLPFVAFMVTRPALSGTVPAIHDITTDLANPPAFTKLPLRADNLTGVGTVDNWRSIHAAAYGDLKPVRIARAPAQVIADAARIAKAQGWEIAVEDPAAGRLEATASVSFIRFHDDIAVRVTPADNGAASVVDVRSVSRVGVSDMGVNAKRIRAFLKELQGV
ncbi:DUF1499 domain-containing protein [Novosphingobium percolationis]|uniref:DUF1499 domain-containing protein n=1 Tax=Novosphingobium percolationis TaxID=2871811 RepID=UPI001CD2E627|nr:DUF1499 domain-containing protein [Novosphingobium percolationis]